MAQTFKIGGVTGERLETKFFRTGRDIVTATPKEGEQIYGMTPVSADVARTYIQANPNTQLSNSLQKVLDNPFQSGLVKVTDTGGFDFGRLNVDTSFLQMSSLESILGQQADIAAGRVREISPGMTVPVGSPADIEIQRREFAQAQLPDTVPSEAFGSNAVLVSDPTETDVFADIQRRIDEITATIGGITGRIATEGLFGPAGSIAPTASGGAAPAPSVPTGAVPTPPSITPPTGAEFDFQSIADAAGLTEFKKNLFEKIAGFFTTGTPTETPAEIAERLFPDLPEKIGEIDTQLAQLDTAFQLEVERITGEPVSTRLFDVRIAPVERIYNIKRNGLLLEREAAMGDFNRATERAKTILTLELEMRQEQRENNKIAIDLMLAEANAMEQRVLAAYQRQLDVKDLAEQRTYNEKIREQDNILSIISNNPQAFIGQSWPTSVQSAMATSGRSPSGADVPVIKTFNGIPYEWDTANGTWTPVDIPGTVYSDAALRVEIRQMMNDARPFTFEEALDAITIFDPILNKKRGYEIAAEMYEEELPERYKGTTPEAVVNQGTPTPATSDSAPAPAPSGTAPAPTTTPESSFKTKTIQTPFGPIGGIPDLIFPLFK